MPSIASFLVALERHDTKPPDHALAAALDRSMLYSAENSSSEDSVERVNDTSRVIWDAFTGTADGRQAHSLLTDFVEERLVSWHSIKVNVLRSAWEADPTTRNLEEMLRMALINTRQGLVEHPELVPDAHLLQNLAWSGHQFSWAQAIAELRADGLPLPADTSIEMRRLAGISSQSLRHLIGTGS